MSKKVKNINVEVNEINNKNENYYEVAIPNKQVIGTIKKVESRYQIDIEKSNKTLFANNLESAINDLLVYFNLHGKI
ncbi:MULTISPECIES: DUF2969 family protein [Holzapfeliella]